MSDLTAQQVQAAVERANLDIETLAELADCPFERAAFTEPFSQRLEDAMVLLCLHRKLKEAEIARKEHIAAITPKEKP